MKLMGLMVAMGLFMAGLSFQGCFSSSGASESDGAIIILHSFDGSDGATAKGSLTLDGNTLYGRTAIGGASNNGTIFSLSTDGSNFKVLHSFSAVADNLEGNQPHHDAMALIGSTLYGTTLRGGNTDNGAKKGNGVIFTIATDGSGYVPLHLFDAGTADGSQPHSCFLVVGSKLFGMTAAGGTDNGGTIFSINSDGSGFTILYSFSQATGSAPHGRLTLATDGKTLLGMTRQGGASSDKKHPLGLGVIFSFDPSSATYTVLHNLTGGSNDGATTEHGFLISVGDSVFGMTKNGGAKDKGVIFSMKETGDNFQLLHTFDGISGDGSEPYGSLAHSNGSLYGMTRKGGNSDDGTIFRIKIDGSEYQILASFNKETTGAHPIDNVVVSEDGKTLYGQTQAGGVNDPALVYQYGTVFALTIP